MVSLEQRGEMPADAVEVREAAEHGINIVNGWGPKEVLVGDEGQVTGIVFKKCTQVTDPETGRFDPQYDESETKTIDCDRIVFAIGQAIEWGDLLDGEGVTFWHGNYPVADRLTYQTKQPDIFVGGDVYTGPRFVIDAIAAGHHVADVLARYVRPDADLTIALDRHQFTPLDKTDILFPDYDHAPRQEEPTHEAGVFDEYRDALTEEQVRTETSRCLSCGASRVDPNKCIGCGICTTRCEFDAIHLHRDHPEMTDMRFAEDKVTGLAGYAAKRAIKIIRNAGSEEAKVMRERRKKYKAESAEFAKTHPNTGNGMPIDLDD